MSSLIKFELDKEASTPSKAVYSVLKVQCLVSGLSGTKTSLVEFADNLFSRNLKASEIEAAYQTESDLFVNGKSRIVSVTKSRFSTNDSPVFSKGGAVTESARIIKVTIESELAQGAYVAVKNELDRAIFVKKAKEFPYEEDCRFVIPPHKTAYFDVRKRYRPITKSAFLSFGDTSE